MPKVVKQKSCKVFGKSENIIVGSMAKIYEKSGGNK